MDLSKKVNLKLFFQCLIIFILSSIYLLLQFLVFRDISFDFFTENGDAQYYISMAQSSNKDIPIPYKYRILTPLIVSLIPFNLFHSYIIYTTFFISLTLSLTYFLFVNHFSQKEGLLAISIIFSSELLWYSLMNPFIVDPLHYSIIDMPL